MYTTAACNVGHTWDLLVLVGIHAALHDALDINRAWSALVGAGQAVAVVGLLVGGPAIACLGCIIKILNMDMVDIVRMGDGCTYVVRATAVGGGTVGRC